jgi:hypothetical protein
MYVGLHVKYPLFLSDFNNPWNLVDRFSKNIQISNFTKICPVGVTLFHADGHGDAKSCFSQFCERVYKYVRGEMGCTLWM